MNAAIYKFTCKINGKIYIGQTNSITTRLREHLKSNTDMPLYNDIKKYGIDKFKFEVLEFISDISKLNEREQYFIDLHIQLGLNFELMFYNNILNITEKSINFSEQTKLKMSLSKKNSKLSKEHIASMSKYSKDNNTVNNFKNKKPKYENISKALRNRYPNILKYDLDGNFIAEYETQKEAALSVNIKDGYNINKALKNILQQAYNYQWKYHTPNYPIKIDSIIKKIKVLNYDKELIGIYNSVDEISNEFNIHRNRIYFALNNSKYNYSSSYYFFYI